MNYQVYLNPTKLSVLSIPRSKCWLFASSILKLLHIESNKTANYARDNLYDSEEDSDEDERWGKDDLKYEFSQSEGSPYSSDYVHSTDESSNRDAESIGSTDKELQARHKRNNVKNRSTLSSSILIDKNEVDNSSKPVVRQSIGIAEQTSIGSSPSESEDDQVFDNDENFLFHVAYTPDECTVICSTPLFKLLFEHVLEVCEKLSYTDVKVVKEEYLSIIVDSDGSPDNSSRILELTKPLAENNISLFFLSTHFSNIVLVPFKQKEKVMHILTKKNFIFSDISNSFIAHTKEDREDIAEFVKGSISSSSDEMVDPSKIFEVAEIRPLLHNNARLLLTGARSGRDVETIQKAAKNIAADNIPDYFAITRSSMNEISLILPSSSKARASMGFHSDTIIGSVQDIIIPIVVDLTTVPLDSTGIVSGLASKIFNGAKELSNSDAPIEMNYLSMARSAIVMVPKERMNQIIKVLNRLNNK